ncbi:hypothetical protein T4B_7316 [Trichinella pseudospiralis]|uniref:Uncharacterized protein n=2 Tax=Trichinella pseudospiralis TaxID=6337 RepID=A0A0V1JCY3_TRIPS|nr:hypothetical protein T4A_3857 [Trichinella pseudospiralis]KRY88962.1 hypothetical protein T4D_1198 [Trichinella pseudospiralis]KRZ27534.1 hypothetical protein T4B_7316 [Trichinella pseudospiralis]KRZ32799.1 hypothetical protein T4C_13894 [Trichinella pseudospiralis]
MPYFSEGMYIRMMSSSGVCEMHYEDKRNKLFKFLLGDINIIQKLKLQSCVNHVHIAQMSLFYEHIILR